MGTQRISVRLPFCPATIPVRRPIVASGHFWSPALILCLCLCLCSLRSINYLSEATDFGVCGGGPTMWIYVYVQLSIINSAAASEKHKLRSYVQLVMSNQLFRPAAKKHKHNSNSPPVLQYPNLSYVYVFFAAGRNN